MLAFAGTESPVEAMRIRARRLVLDAIEQGWAGPPFDSFKLAEMLQIEIASSQEVVDARTVFSGSRLRIEYNPNRGLNRARFSVAHEIVHTLFPDCSETIRYRLPYHSGEGDSWQLEMLCNIGAAEILMPVGSGLECPINRDDFAKLLDLRDKYKVSTEALLLRLARLCGLTVFAASCSPLRGQPTINYLVSSPAGPRMKEGTLLPSSSVVTQCTAIGYSAQGVEKWPQVGEVYVQCVGVPPYPGHVKPRVLGIIRRFSSESRELPPISYVRGDATDPRGIGRKIVVQLVNDKASTWGAGFSLAVRRKWPEAQRRFTAWIEALPKPSRLGKVHFFEPSADIMIASVIAQAGYGPSPRPRIRYNILDSGLTDIGRQAIKFNASVHMPRLGCGEAGGSWSIVGELIEANLASKGVPVTIYDLPWNRREEVQPTLPGLFGG